MAAALFVVGWFLPLQGTKDEQMAPAMFFVLVGEHVASGEASIGMLLGFAAYITGWAIALGVLAFISSWLIQCVVQIVRAR